MEQYNMRLVQICLASLQLRYVPFSEGCSVYDCKHLCNTDFDESALYTGCAPWHNGF